MTRLREIIDEAYHINLTMIEKISSSNGIVEEISLDKAKKRILDFATDYLKEDLVDVKKSYPEQDETEVELSVNFVILQRHEYMVLKKLIDKLDR